MTSKEKPRSSAAQSLSVREIRSLERERFHRIDIGKLKHRWFLGPCEVKILMLVDQGISFNQFYFGLSEVLDTLRDNPEWWVNFEVTRAHRQTDPNPPAGGSPAEALYAPHFENFMFTQDGFDIDDYDQVWFFGFNSSQSTAGEVPPALTDDELEILFAWMDRGGGVFATGDHATLGASLCARIPRVRSMRRWLVDTPPNLGPTRHDTLVKGYDVSGTAADESSQYTFDDESDDVPMRIRLRWYSHHHCHGGGTVHHHHHHHHHHHWHWPYFWRRSPHPVLCGKDGPIDILPDHPHEGEVVTPSNLTENPSFNAYTAREYPDLSGAPLEPEIIAWARVQDDHGPSPISFKGPADAKEFGAIGAYNGHCVDVGRVVVDSTWHHWFDVNLTGRMSFGTDLPGNVQTGDPRKLNGFNDTPEGVVALDRIRNYFRNTAVWLSPKSKIRCMALRAFWNGIYRYPLYADLSSKLPIWVIGHHAIDVLGRYAGQCQVVRWWPVIFPRLRLEELIDPEKLRVPVESLRMLDEFVIGGILSEMLKIKEERGVPEKLPSDEQLAAMGERGAASGLEAWGEHITASQETNEAMLAVLMKVRR